ncbi:UNVERIFIED_CONTAM: hypothetical protein Sradi_2914600 [Sesamum radiatum]|uniref:Uncharacterized protein n=1 Tax=Sesamum radiatum TaxID=300843 RepID=A0AAW2S0R9_SESRA
MGFLTLAEQHHQILGRQNAHVLVERIDRGRKSGFYAEFARIFELGSWIRRPRTNGAYGINEGLQFEGEE